MKRKTWLLTVMAVVSAVAGSHLLTEAAAAQQPPPAPVIYSGSVSVSSGEDPDGFFVTARVLDYESQPVEVVEGEYAGLSVQLPANNYANQTVTFHLDGVQAQETDTSFLPGLPVIKSDFGLTFLNLPFVAPAVYSGSIVVAGQEAPVGQLVARIGAYESPAITTSGPEFTNLVVAPPDESAIGQPVQFFLNGFPSSPPAPALAFKPGEFRMVNLVFVDFPTPLPEPTPTRSPAATKTPLLPTSTPTPEPTPTQSPAATKTPLPFPTPAPPVPTPFPPQAPATLGFTPTRFDFDASQSVEKTLTIYNTGDETLTWTLEADADWIILARPNGTTGAGESNQIQLSVDAGAIRPGTYTAKIRISASTQANEAREIPVTLRLAETPTQTDDGLLPSINLLISIIGGLIAALAAGLGLYYRVLRRPHAVSSQ